MTEALSEGDVIAVFPEGTTGDGNTVLPFHANLLQAAISSGAPVQPMALRFADAATGEISLAPRYIGEDNLPTSLWKVLKAPPLLAIVRFGKPQLVGPRPAGLGAVAACGRAGLVAGDALRQRLSPSQKNSAPQRCATAPWAPGRRKLSSCLYRRMLSQDQKTLAFAVHAA